MNNEDKILKILEQLQNQFTELNSKVDNNHKEVITKLNTLEAKLVK